MLPLSVYDSYFYSTLVSYDVFIITTKLLFLPDAS